MNDNEILTKSREIEKMLGWHLVSRFIDNEECYYEFHKIIEGDVVDIFLGESDNLDLNEFSVLGFHRDWNKLMDAVTYIKGLEKDWPMLTDKVCHTFVTTPIDELFIMVYDFAKEYNKINQVVR